MLVFPSILAAYVCSFPTLYLIFWRMFNHDLSKGEASCVPSGMATAEAISVGLLIPFLSAIIPIQRALAKTLSESLNTARATLSGTVIIIRGKGVQVLPYIVFGLLCTLFGVTIYVILPQALLAENAGLVLQIFFLILVGMILGLALLTANLRGFLEAVAVYLLPL